MCFPDKLLNCMHYFSQNPSFMKLFKIPFLLQNLTCEWVHTNPCCHLWTGLRCEIFILLGYGNVSLGDWCPTFSDRLVVNIWRSDDHYAVLQLWAPNHPLTQCQISEEQTSQLHQCKSLKSHIVCAISVLGCGLAYTIANTNKTGFI
jgi:hypothetical protein